MIACYDLNMNSAVIHFEHAPFQSDDMGESLRGNRVKSWEHASMGLEPLEKRPTELVRPFPHVK